MKAAIFGLGKMGVPTAWAMKMLGYEVVGFEANKCRKFNDQEALILADTHVYFNDFDINKELLLKEKPDVVISCMPYFENEYLANFCARNELAYCDLGGSVPVSEILNTLNASSKKPVFTDLGLAPGLISLLALKVMKDLPFTPDDALLAVGGMGCNDEFMSPVYYTCNWSVDGLINELMDDCDVLVNGEIVKRPGSSEPVDVEEGMCAFNTSGGIGNLLPVMQKAGVKNCAYKTIRYKKHYELLDYLLNTVKYSRKEMATFFAPVCTTTSLDNVFLFLGLSKGRLSYLDKMVHTGENFSAMQECTAFTLASVADMVAKRGVRSYEDVVKNWPDFKQNMTLLGVDGLL